MYLKEIIIKNFRAFKNEHRIPINDLTAFVGKNDAGKSTVFDALAIFFNNPLVKIDEDDVCKFSGNSCEVRIGCAFSDLPSSITIDATSTTTLGDEYLLNKSGYLEIHKVFECTDGKLKKEKTVAIANHPTVQGFNDLLYKKNAELKKIGEQVQIDSSIDKRSNVDLRHAIWNKCDDLQLDLLEVQLDKEDAKRIWEKVEVLLPEFALFKADRSSTDEDIEVQDPLKVAVKLAIKEVEVEINQIKEKVKDRAYEVAKRTIEKMADIDGGLASELKPVFKTDPKWDSLFKLSLTSDDEIPLNKRGSGVRRLVVLSFFRAEAERVESESTSSNIIYAIEEPETAQHPNNQKKIIEALKAISETEGFQVLLTTHVPGLISIVPDESIRYITNNSVDGSLITYRTNDIYSKVAADLGVLPDTNVKVIVCVEGPNDIRFFRSMNQILKSDDPSIIDIFSDPRVTIIPLGGKTLKDWVNQNYLGRLGIPEVHIYDRDKLQSDGKYPYQDARDEVNNRGNGSIAFLTTKREIENYLHLDAINEVLQPILNRTISFCLDDECDVESEIMSVLNGQHNIKKRNVKLWLNEDVSKKMTVNRLRSRNGYDEIKNWFVEIGRRV